MSFQRELSAPVELLLGRAGERLPAFCVAERAFASAAL